MDSTSTAREIETRLRRRLDPLHLEIHDDSAAHAGHRGATSGGGHFRVVVVSTAFAGLSRLDRHRRVHEILADLFGPRIHALSMRTLDPGEWEASGGG